MSVYIIPIAIIVYFVLQNIITLCIDLRLHDAIRAYHVFTGDYTTIDYTDVRPQRFFYCVCPVFWQYKYRINPSAYKKIKYYIGIDKQLVKEHVQKKQQIAMDAIMQQFRERYDRKE